MGAKQTNPYKKEPQKRLKAYLESDDYPSPNQGYQLGNKEITKR